MRRGPIIALLASWVVAACAAGGAGGMPPAPAPLDPVGTFSFSTDVQGQTVTGRVIIQGEPGAYWGTIQPDPGAPFPPIEISSVTVTGQELTVAADLEGQDLLMTLVFTGETYIGTWVFGFDTGEVSGARIP